MFGSRAARAAAILTYHSLDDDGTVLSVSPRLFADQMAMLGELGVAVVPLADLRRPGAPAPRVAITFDDGFRSVREHAWPILARHGFPATVFLVTDFCGRTNDWPGQPAHVVRRPLLDWAEVRAMAAAGVAFGSHTRSHSDLTGLAPRAMEAELVGSKQAIEDAVGRPVEALAYPYGTHDETVRRLAGAHFALACGTRLGHVGAASDRLALPRLDAYYLRRPRLFPRLFTSELAGYLRLRQLGRDLRAAARRRP